MKVFNNKADISTWSKTIRREGKKIGFVPTMGALHKGHLELVNCAKKDNDVVACSIFVNPIQFNNPEDLNKYPRTFKKDAEMLKALGCDAIFHPDTKEMYPEPETKKYDFGNLERVMEGRYRPGHFNGVAIVVKKLFDIVMPDRAYFGEKDFQQLAIIKALVRKEKMKVEIVSCPTVREFDGLAMSSRNVRLNTQQRENAPLIYQTLCKAKKMYQKHSVEFVKTEVERIINGNPHMKLEYFEISDTETLEPVSDPKPETPVVACIAVYMDEVRLIDNMLFNL